jgi:hypothetical protein
MNTNLILENDLLQEMPRPGTIKILEEVNGWAVEREVQMNPYGRAARIRKERPHRSLLVKRTQKDAPGYTWSMGYNNIVGRYSGGNPYSRLSGSSLNRSLKTMTDEEKLFAGTAHLIAVAKKVGAHCRRIGWKVQGPFRDLLCCPCLTHGEKYTQWLSEQVFEHVDGGGYGLRMFSARSRAKVKDKATAFFRSCPGSRVFATLTFIQSVDDLTAVGILNKFLTSIRKEFPGVQFLWVAERQKKNREYPDNIHFHMIINRRLPVKRFNGLWVLQQYNAGLVGKSKYGEYIAKSEIESRFREGTVGEVLNPLDLVKTYNINGLSAYLTKYITKQDKGDVFACSVWHCSRGVSKLFTKATVSPSAFRYAQTFNNYKLDRKTGECTAAQVVKGPFYVMVYANNKEMPLRYLREMEQVNKWIIQGMQVNGALRDLSDELYAKYFLNQNVNDETLVLG